MTDANRQPSFAIRLPTFAPANGSDHSVHLVVSQDYSPCQIILQSFNIYMASDSSGFAKEDNNLEFSNISAMDVQNLSAGVTWIVENPAPEETGTDATGGVSKRTAGYILLMAHASLVGAILVGSIS